jgi:hypothetical protein
MVDQVDQLLELAMCDHWWLPKHTHVVRRPEIEYLFSDQDRNTFNAVVRVQPEVDFGPLIGEVVAAHPGKHSEWRIGAPSYSVALEAAVLASGYRPRHVSDAWSIDSGAPRPSLPDGIRIERVEYMAGLRDMSRLMTMCFGGSERNDGELRDDLVGCVGPEARCRRFVAFDSRSGEPLSTGALNLYPALGLGFLWGGCTNESARGRGIYSALVTARMNEARAEGIERLAVYAIRDTSGPIVKAQGFRKHGEFRSWVRVQSDVPRRSGRPRGECS